MRLRTLAPLLAALALGPAVAFAQTPGPGKLPPRRAAAPPAAKGPKATVVERVVAVVGNEVILETELYQHATPQLAELEQAGGDRTEKAKQYKVILRKSLDELVDDELIIQAGTEAGLAVEDAEVDKAVNEVKKQNKLTDEQLAAALKQQGYTPTSYRKDVRRQILRLRTVNTLVRPRVSITDEEIKERYDRDMRKAGAVTEVHVAHLLLTLPENATDAQRTEARRHAGELVERARGGEDFAALVASSTQDDSTKGNGGDIGWFKRGELPTAWESQLFAGEAGDIRGPIDGPTGVQVFKIIATKRDAMKPFADAKDALQREMYADEMEKQTKLWVEELRRKANIEIKL